MKVIGPDDPALAALDGVFAAHPEWQAALEIIPWPEYRGRLMSALEAGESPYQAVFVPGHVWIPELAQAGRLAPLDPELVSLEQASLPAGLVQAYQEDDLLPSVRAESAFGAQRYQLPVFSDGHILFYRPDLVGLEQAGLKQAKLAAGAGGPVSGVPVVPPSALGDLAAQAHHPPEVYGLALKAHPSEILLDWLPFLWEQGGDILDADGRPAFAGEAGVRALELYSSLRQFCPPGTHTFANGEIAQVIREGKAALVTTWGGQAGPLYLEPGSRVGEMYATAVYPRPWNGTWGMAVPANLSAAARQAALSVLLQACSPELDKQITRLAGSPVRLSSYSEEQVRRYPWLPAQQEMLARAGNLPADPRLGAFLGSLYEAVYAAFTGAAEARPALLAAEQRALETLQS